MGTLRRPCELDSTTYGAPLLEASASMGWSERSSPTTSDEVAAALAAAEAAAAGGSWVAGFVAYEAAPAFDRAFRVTARPDGDVHRWLPLVWFGVFTEKVDDPPWPDGGTYALGSVVVDHVPRGLRRRHCGHPRPHPPGRHLSGQLRHPTCARPSRATRSPTTGISAPPSPVGTAPTSIAAVSGCCRRRRSCSSNAGMIGSSHGR